MRFAQFRCVYSFIRDYFCTIWHGLLNILSNLKYSLTSAASLMFTTIEGLVFCPTGSYGSVIVVDFTGVSFPSSRLSLILLEFFISSKYSRK